MGTTENGTLGSACETIGATHTEGKVSTLQVQVLNETSETCFFFFPLKKTRTRGTCILSNIDESYRGGYTLRPGFIWITIGNRATRTYVYLRTHTRCTYLFIGYIR